MARGGNSLRPRNNNPRLPDGAFSVDISSEDHVFGDKRVILLTIGTAGDLKVQMNLGGDVTIPANQVTKHGAFWGNFTKVYKTGTAASEITAWYY